MNGHQIIMVVLFLAFAVEAWASIANLKEGGLVSLSFIALLEAIWLLLEAYDYLRSDLEERLKATS